MALKQGVQIEGLKDFIKELKEVDKSFAKEVGGVNQKIAQSVVDHASSTALGLGGVAAKVIAMGGLKASKAVSAAQVILGGAPAPFALGAEFGGGGHGAANPTPRRGYTTQFAEWRGNGQQAGYFLYPTIRADRDQIGDRYLDLLMAVSKKAFPN